MGWFCHPRLSASLDGFHDACRSQSLANSWEKIAVPTWRIFFPLSFRRNRKFSFTRTLCPKASIGAKANSNVSPPARGRQEGAWDVPQYICISHCSSFFIKTSAYIQLVVMSSSSHFYPCPMEQFYFIKGIHPRSAFENIFFHFLCLFATWKKTLTALVS